MGLVKILEMCGRYTIKDPAGAALQIAIITGEDIDVVAARYNVSPSQVMRIILGGDKPKAQDSRWGLVPFWDKSEKPKMAPINARSEEAFTKPMFRQSIQKRRCVIPADGFYEWQKLDEKTKVPFHICRKDNAVFFFAGIYEEATEIRPPTYLLFTCQPNELMSPIHNRMPAILSANRIKDWLAPGNLSESDFASFCQPYPTDQLGAYPVSSMVNKPVNDIPECVQPIGEIVIKKTQPPRTPLQPDLFT